MPVAKLEPIKRTIHPRSLMPTRRLSCTGCDLLQCVPELPRGGKAYCARCGQVVAARPTDPIDRPLALTLTALILLLVANTAPLMELSAVGRSASTTIIGGAYQMWIEGEPLTAVIVLGCAVLAPIGYVLFLLVLLVAARRPPAPCWVGRMLRWADEMRAWSMIEVMLIGILVALIKIAELARVEAGIGIYAVGALVLLFPAIIVSFDADEIWRRIRWVDGEDQPTPGSPAPAAEGRL